MKAFLFFVLTIFALFVPVFSQPSQPIDFDHLDSLALEQQFNTITQKLILIPEKNLKNRLYDLQEIHKAYTQIKELYGALDKALQNNQDLSFAINNAKQEQITYSLESVGPRAMDYVRKFQALIKKNDNVRALQSFYLGRMHKKLYRDRLLKEIETHLIKAAEANNNIALQQQFTAIQNQLYKLGAFPQRKAIEHRMHSLQISHENNVKVTEYDQKWRISFSLNTRLQSQFASMNIDWAYYGVSFNEKMNLTLIYDQQGEAVAASSGLLPPRGATPVNATSRVGKGFSLELDRLLGSRFAIGSFIEYGQMVHETSFTQSDLALSWMALAVQGKTYILKTRNINHYLSIGLAGTFLYQDRYDSVILDNDLVTYFKWTDHYIDKINTMILNGLAEFGTEFLPGLSRFVFELKLRLYYPFVSQNLETQWQYGLNFSAGYSF
ncbi:hypothetical protein GF406_25550 [candidate division KSB1 bacterium]|nr:hypothetical protein [candidate division KSB1 bacterium]